MRYTAHGPHLKNPHLHTLLAATARHVPTPPGLVSERLELADGDFLDMDWHLCARPADTLVVLSHGLEGHARRPYMLGMARAANAVGVDALAWSFRGCSGVPNALPRLYHGGSADDLEAVVQRAAHMPNPRGRRYTKILLVGFSMGGNMTMLYLGRAKDRLPAQISGFVAFSAPCDLNDCIRMFERPQGLPYTHYFLRTLKDKVRRKAAQFPGDARFDTRGLERITSLRAYDDRYTAPIHGFASAVDYWTRSSSRPHLAQLTVPGVIANALDDPFLMGGCFPYEEVAQNPLLELITPAHGAHVGFLEPGPIIWSERLVMRQLTTI